MIKRFIYEASKFSALTSSPVPSRPVPSRTLFQLPSVPFPFPLVLFMRSHNVTYKSNSIQRPAAPFRAPGVIKTNNPSLPCTDSQGNLNQHLTDQSSKKQKNFNLKMY